MKIFVAFDHAGFELKEKLKAFLAEEGHDVEDCGAFTYDADDDYPDFIRPCAEKVAATPGSFGIIGGASGQGEAMVANRVPGVRAALYYGEPDRKQTDMGGKELDMIASTREHNDANVLSIGSRFLSEEQIKEKIRTFLSTPFSGAERHQRRINKF
ncbi:MAG: RpiB/LacA/LacB family sugar-phosphate isomerase [Patescibacteria group bacterium]